MKARYIVRKIMEDENITNADFARKLNITPAALWDRLNTTKTKDIPVSTLNDMLMPLGYKIAIIPNTTPIPNGGYEVTRSEKTEPISSNKAKEKATALLDSLPDPKPVQNPIDTTSGKVKIKLT